MEFFLVPWQVFLDALKKQSPSTREAWLRRWGFTDEGAVIAASEKVSAPLLAPAVSAAR